MASLDNITSKILSDANEKANQIISEAKSNANEKYDREIKKYNSQKAILEDSAKREEDLAVERIKSGANLKIRNDKLQAKQAVIDKVIAQLQEELVNMPEAEYIDYLKKNIDASTIASKKLIVKKEFVDAVKKEFSNAVVDENEFVTSGFILEENGVQENYTFEVKLKFIRDELEVQISELLFS